MEVMNQARRLKRLRKGATAAGQAAAEAAVPSKKIKFLAQEGTAGKGDMMGVDEGDSDDANADIVMKFSKVEQAVRKKAAIKAHEAHEKDANETKMSKGKMKALQKLKDRQEREAKREELFASLAKHHVDSRAVGLLKSSSSIGAGRETKKQKLSRALKEERAGVAVTASSDLVVGMESHAVGESARARRKRLQREQEEREMALLASSSDGSGEDESGDGDKEDEKVAGQAVGSDAEAGETEEAEEAAEAEAEIEIAASQAPREESVNASNGEGGAHSKGADSEPAQRKPAFYVTVKRNPEIQQARSKLPMFAEEQQVMETIRDNDVIVLCGATGCGKSTQLPQFLFEAGYGSEKGFPGMIGCTQPRRVAAITTAKRIAKELNMPLGKQVGFQVRYEKRIDKDTKIKVMTDGILLKEIQSDFLLSDYSAIVVDEAHERGINSDVLIGLLSRLVPLRRKGMTKDGRLLPPLKLIIMSATLRVTDFTENAPLFPVPPPVVEVSARQHPVTVHFNRRTPIYTYMQEALKKACKIHRKLPGGGILIFLTGRREIDWMCRNLREELAQHKNRSQKPKARPQLRDGAFTAAGPNAGEKRKIKDETATELEGEEKTEESGHKEAFLFGQDDGADSDVDDADAAEDGADYDDDDEAEEKALRADDDESSEDEDLLDDEYDLSESEEEDAEHDSDEESEDEEAKSKRTVLLDGAALAKGAAGLTGNDIGSATRRTPTATVAKEADKPTDAAQSDAPKRAKVSKRPSKVLVLPLYSMLSGPQQLKAFNRAPKGVRVIVVATNVAETSITIPGMRYVVDTVCVYLFPILCIACLHCACHVKKNNNRVPVESV